MARRFLMRRAAACLLMTGLTLAASSASAGAGTGAGALRALDDQELAQVTARDGISFAAHISLNDPTLVGAVSDSRLSLGFNGDGQNRYIVF